MSPPTSLLQYQQTPAAIMAVLNLFHQYNVCYVLFKCEHIFEGQNKNLDILFKTNDDYQNASTLLEKNGFVLRFGEEFERYKQMYCRYEDGIMISIHLHREIAWHGMVALDKKAVFTRAKKVHPLIVIPSLEDSILIHAAHTLFENFTLREREKEYLNRLEQPNVDQAYIQKQITSNHWQYGFQKLQSKKGPTIPFSLLFTTWSIKLAQEPLTAFYVIKKSFRKLLRPLHRFGRRKGCLIALIGVNGSGKTTISKELVHAYAPLVSHLGVKQHYYYFGWEPTFILTKLVSTMLKKIKVGLFQRHTVAGRKDLPGLPDKENKKISCSLLQELSFVYQFLEFYYRSLAKIRPKLQQKGVVITDRYFYDIFGQYPSATKSIVLPALIKFFPKPDFTILLRCDIKNLTTRDKFSRDKNEWGPRTLFPVEYLQQQMDNYASIKNYVPLQEMDSTQSLQHITQKIIEESWKEVVRKS